MEIELFEWDKFYSPVKNHLDENASLDGIMFETYGEELQYVLKQDIKSVWTYIQGDDGVYIIPNYHLVNRIGYFITSTPWENEDVSVIVSLDRDWDGHLRDLSIEDLGNITCWDCGIAKMDDEACIVAIKNNEAICVNCCGDCV